MSTRPCTASNPLIPRSLSFDFLLPIQDLVARISKILQEQGKALDITTLSAIETSMKFFETDVRADKVFVQTMCSTFASCEELRRDWIDAYACFSGYLIKWAERSVVDLTPIPTGKTPREHGL